VRTLPSRRLVWPSSALLLLLVSIGTWALAAQARTPQQLAARAKAPDPSVISVPVSWQRLTRSTSLTCRAVWADLTTVAVPTSTSAMITRIPLQTGKHVAEGQVVLELAARPVIAIEGQLPPFRDLVAGTQGPDVAQLQHALARLGLLPLTAVTGKYDKATGAAVGRLYKRNGYPAPITESTQPTDGTTGSQADQPKPVTPLPQGELVVLPHLPAQLDLGGSKLGTLMAPGRVSLGGGSTLLRCTGDLSELAGVTKGAPAEVTTPKGRQIQGSVQSVSAPSPNNAAGDSVGISQVEVVLHLTTVGLTPGEGYQADVITRSASSAGPVVPASALYTRPGGLTVLLVRRAGGTVEMSVDAVLDVGGQVQVKPLRGAVLGKGDYVVVSTANPPTS
jgi:peptidoglycan hydrolase-like protein with peptidoglycan-binding domain